MRKLYLTGQVDGEFNGWEGETIVKLTNRQTWQQSQYYYYYFYFYMPQARIYTNNGFYEMEIVGTNVFIPVTRVY